MTATLATDALQHAVTREYLKLYVVLLVGLWLLVDGLEGTTALLLETVPRLAGVFSATVAVVGFFLTVIGVVGIAYKVNHS